MTLNGEFWSRCHRFVSRVASSARHRVVRIQEAIGNRSRVGWRRLRYRGLLRRARAAKARNDSWVVALDNSLPNTGAIPTNASPEGTLATAQAAPNRRAYAVGFEGLALDDALVYANEHKHLSYIPLARTFSSLGQAEFGRRFSVLELGSGRGAFFAFLNALGIEDYLGIDVNPVAFNNSPHIKGPEGHFRLLNLQETIDCRASFDVVCTFEVLEHIRRDRLAAFLESIGRHMSRSSLFLGTASLQVDHDVHVTVEERPFWLERFHEHGLVPHPNHRRYENELGRNHPFHWHPGNTNMFAMQLANREGT